uniref:Methyltransferase domain-containing protein n=1 Tax=Ciona savignyi TaxID=51511 RepID=H2Z0R4_CIOSA
MAEEAWGRMFSAIGQTDTRQHYNDYAAKYEQDCACLGYSEPEEMVGMLKEVLPNFSDDHLQVLDIAAGTGLMGELLRSANFKGVIDGIDGSANMLEKAREKGIYRNLIEEFVLPDKALPLKDQMYDVTCCLGSMSVPHIQPEALKEFVRVTKTGGMMGFAVVTTPRSGAYEQKLAEIVKSLENSGQWKNLKAIKSAIFQYNFDKIDAEKTYTTHYVFERL